MGNGLLFVNINHSSFWVSAYCAFLLFILIQLPDAQAHPHVFITQHLTVIFDDKGLAGFEVRWKFDDMFANMITEDYDLNRNGILEKDEVSIVKEKVFSYLSNYSYFTFIKIQDTPFEVKFIKDFNAILKNKGLIYEFFIPCHVTATNDLKKISVATYDPSYYSAIFFEEKEPFLAMDHESENTLIYGSRDIEFLPVNTDKLHQAYTEMTFTLKSMIENMITCLSVTSNISCELYNKILL